MLFFKIFVQSWRMIRSYKLYSIINVLGLSFSLVCVLVLSKYIWREFTTDGFHPSLERLYFMTSQGKLDNVEYLDFFEDPNNCRDIDINHVPEVECFTQIIPITEEVTIGSRKVKMDLLVTDSNYFEIFGFPLLAGDLSTVLVSPDQVVISTSFAHKFFGKENPLGKSIQVFDKTYTISGITNKVPYNSSFESDLLVPVHSRTRWTTLSIGIYRLYPNSNVSALNERIKIPLKFYPRDVNESIYQFRPFKGYYLRGVHCYSPTIKQGNLRNLYLLGMIALTVLFIGILNFINIYTITLLRRGKELGIKKVFGVGGKIMMTQFLMENLLLIFGAVLVALLFFVLLHNYIEGKLNMSIVCNPEFDIPLILGILFLLPFCTTIYPFLKYHYNSPITSIKDLRTSSRHSGQGRSLFLVIQYIMTVAVIIVSLVFMRQLQFMLNADLGYEKDHIVKAAFLKRPSYTQIYQTEEEWEEARNNSNIKNALLVNELKRNPYIEEWSCNDSPNSLRVSEDYSISVQGTDHWIKYALMNCDAGTFNMYGFRLKEGRMFHDSLDYFGSNTLIINETAKKMLGIDRLGSVLKSSHPMWWSDGTPDPQIYTVIGVIEDFRFEHLSRSVGPVLLSYDNDRDYLEDREVSVKIVPGKEPEVLKTLEDLYHKVNEGGEFTCSFISDEIASTYHEDRQITRVYSVFAIIAILISSMGLFSLSLYDVKQRTREIAIRKVNGATVFEVLSLLSLRYYKLLLLSYLLALPLSLWIVSDYLSDFAVRAPLSWWIFALAAIITGLVSLLTLWWQIWRAAIANPANAVKVE